MLNNDTTSNINVVCCFLNFMTGVFDNTHNVSCSIYIYDANDID